jgi:hypothetical protein
MRFRIKGTSAVGRAFAGRRLRATLAIAAASLLGLTVTSVVQVAPANATPTLFALVNAHSLDCMSNGGFRNGYVSQFACGGTHGQVWYFGGTHGAYQQIISYATGQCVGVQGGSLANGARIWMGNCSSNDIFYWQKELECTFIVGCAPGVDFWVNQASGRVIQVGCGCNNNSAGLFDDALSDAGPPSQLWYYQAD